MENNNTAKTTKSLERSFEELYAKKEYKLAINQLLQNKQQFSSGTFHYNLGTTYAKLGDFGAARFHLEQAQNLGLVNSATQNNLNFVKSKIDADDLSNSTSISDQILNTSLLIPNEAYYSISLFLLLILVILGLAKKIENKWKFFIFCCLAITPILYLNIYLINVNQAIALKEISVYEGPSKIFQEKGKIKLGSKVILGEFKDGWFFVKSPVSLAGWINRDNLGIF